MSSKSTHFERMRTATIYDCEFKQLKGAVAIGCHSMRASEGRHFNLFLI